MRRLLIVTLIASCLGMSFLACTESECENQIAHEITSPDGKKIATLFLRNCGATTAIVQAVEIKRSNEKFSGVNQKNYIFTMRGQHEVGMRWLASDQLQVSRPKYADDIFHELKAWDGTKISYAPE